MKRILVPLDGSDFAEKALEPALHLAARHGAELCLASIVTDMPPPAALAVDTVDLVSGWLDEEERRVGEYLADARSRLGPAWGSLRIETEVRVGRVVPSLLQLADEVAADLIALTTHGRGALERVWLGSVADQLVRSSTIPLLLLRVGEGTVPPFAEESYPTHVLVPLDGSEAAEAVLGILGKILPGSGGRVTLMTVLERPAMPPSVYLPDTVSEAVVQEKERERAESHLAQVEGRLERRGSGAVEHVVVEATDVSRRLLEECEASDVDLIALATEGRGAVARFFVGSVADKLIRGSHLPVLVARRPESPNAA